MDSFNSKAPQGGGTSSKFQKVAAFSTKGAATTTNDDFAVADQESGIFLVCDGRNGTSPNGRKVSEEVSRTLHEQLLKQPLQDHTGLKQLQFMQNKMIEAFVFTQEHLQELEKTDSAFHDASCAATLLWMTGNFAVVGHLGDTRAYLYRAGKLHLMTKDHCGLDELIQLGVDPDQARLNPLAKVRTRSLGGSRFQHPDLLKIEFQPNDQLFLCTDGVHGSYAESSHQPWTESLATGQELKPILERCSAQSGDDSTLIQIQFAQQILAPTQIQASERIRLIQETPLSKYFDYVQRSHIAAICELNSYPAGTVVIQEGTEGDSLYIVAKGKLGVSTGGSHLTHKKQGDFFGEVGLIRHDFKRTATVTAVEDSLLLSLKRSDLIEVFKKNSEIEKHFYHAMLEMVLDRMIEQGNEIIRIRQV